MLKIFSSLIVVTLFPILIIGQKNNKQIPITAHLTHNSYPFTGEYIGETKKVKQGDEKVIVPHGTGSFTGFIVGSETRKKLISDGFNNRENKALSLLDQSWESYNINTSISENENFAIETAVFLRRLKYTRKVPSTPNGGSKLKIYCDDAKKTFIIIKFEEYQLPSYNPNNASVLDVSSYSIAEAAFKNITLIHNIGGEKVVDNFRAPKIDYSKYTKLRIEKKGQNISLLVNDKELFSLQLDANFSVKTVVLDKDDSHDVFYDFLEIEKITFDQRNKLTYSGDWNEGKFEGPGTLQFENIELIGTFTAGVLNGIGTAQGPDYAYQGEFVNSIPQGKGKIQTKNYDYEGEVSNWRPENFGTMKILDNVIKEGFLPGNQYQSPPVFQGNFKNGIINGNGKMTFPNGDVLDGFWSEYKFTGKGKLRLADGSVYTGEWTNGEKNGSGKLVTKEGDVLEGLFESDLFSGQGKIRFDDGSVYEGELKRSTPEGKGKISHPKGYFIEGDFTDGLCTGSARMKYKSAFYLNEEYAEDKEVNGTYEGPVADGLPSGKGVFISDARFKTHKYDAAEDTVVIDEKPLYYYSGEWLDGAKNGQGKLEYLGIGVDPISNEVSSYGVSVYEGLFESNLFHGNGKLVYVDLNDEYPYTYIGSFKNGQFDGIGELTKAHQIGGESHYVGSFVNGEYHGKGKLTFTFNSKTIYEGDFLHGNRHGYGKITYGEDEFAGADWNDFDVLSYEGNWANDYAEGTGILKFKDGKVVNGQFSAGKFLKPYTGLTAKIGNQVWMAQNLNVSTFRNGDEIMEAKTVSEWQEAYRTKTPAWCYYNNDPSTAAKYGKIYNIYAVIDSRGLAPAGYHIPATNECAMLIDAAQPEIVAQRKKIEMQKSQGISTSDLEVQLSKMEGNYGKINAAYNLRSTKGWLHNGGNRYGFNASPTAIRRAEGDFFIDNGDVFSIWSLSPDRSRAWKFCINGEEFRDRQGYLIVASILITTVDGIDYGYPVRCVKD